MRNGRPVARLRTKYLISRARDRRRGTVVIDAHVPMLYLKMIETDNYGLISDRLYLIPFLRKLITDKAETRPIEAATVVPVA